MTLKGNLEVLNLSDIFQSLSLNQHTGTLRVTDGKREKLVHFAQGEITLLASEKKVKIGEMLVASGKISSEDLDYALQQQKKSKKRLGEILIEEGFVTEDDIAEIVRQQIEAEIYDLFLWKKAEFEFLIDYIPEKLKNPHHGITKLQFNTSSLIMEALRRLDEWGLISKEISTLKEVYKVVNPNAQALDQIDLPERVKTEIKLIDGEKTVEAIAEETSLSEFEICKLLYELKRSGIVAPLTPQELSDRAEEAFQNGKFRQASSLYERLVEVLPKNLSIRWHLADSLKAFGDEARALEEYLFIVSALEGTRDRIELAKAYRAVLDLAPDRRDVLEKLRALDKAKWQRTAVKSGVLVAAIALVAIGVFLAAGHSQTLGPLKERIVKFLSRSGSRVQAEERKARELLNAQEEALRGGDPAKAFELGWRILTAYPSSGARAQVVLPITIRSDPPGKSVFIDGIAKGATDGIFQFFPKKEAEGKLKIELKDAGRTLHTEEVDASVYHDLSIDLYKRPVWEARAEGAIRMAPVFRGNVAYFGSLDGRLYGRVIDDEKDPVLNVPLCESGEPTGELTSGLAFADDNVIYGTLDGDLKGFNLAGRARAFSIHISDEPILARPVVAGGGQTAVVAGNDGAITFVALRRHAAAGNPIPTANRITADLAVADNIVFVAGRDNRVLALDGLERRDLWFRAGRGDYLAAPVPAGDQAVVVGDATGEVACLDRRTGATIWTGDVEAAVVGIGAAGDSVYVATKAGALFSLQLGTGRIAWRAATPKRPGKPVAEGPVVMVGGDGAFVGFDRETGKELWSARAKGAFRGEPVVYGGRVYVGTEDGVLYAFLPE